MRVLYDGMTYVQQETGGINRYFANLIARLPDDVEPTLTTATRRDLHFPRHPRLRVRYFKRFAFRPGRLSYWLEKRYFRHFSKGFDIVHPTYYGTLSGMQWKAFRAKLVITVYDLIHERLGPHMVVPDVYASGKRAAIEAADAVLCISEHTRADLLDLYAVDPAKVHVTYLAAELGLPETSAPSAGPPPPMNLLFVGGRLGYKNFDALLHAFARLAPAYPGLLLRVVGSSPFNENEKAKIDAAGLRNRVYHLGSVDDAQLARLYQEATVFVYPSLYEGFGIPALEAMACGSPVVVADRTSLPEVVGNAGLRFDPDVPGALEEAIDALLRSPELRADLIRRGLKQQQRFDWDLTARQTVRVYETLLA
jgi:glycosyltransferase involved in cell wall biosynthesis